MSPIKSINRDPHSELRSMGIDIILLVESSHLTIYEEANVFW